MIVDKLYKREIVKVLKADMSSHNHTVAVDAKMNAMFVTWSLVEDLELNPGDEMTVDVRILVERRSDMGKQF